MSYNVCSKILGFPDTLKVSIVKIDDLFSTMSDDDNENISFTIVNPNILREYELEMPEGTEILLGINEKSNISVYNILVIQKPLEKSTINFLAPIIVNHDNDKLTQVILEPIKHPDFGMAETIESFKK